jgi:hypothetical protein
MKPNSRAILARCIEEGIAYGVRRAFKYSADDVPPESTFEEQISNGIWIELDQYFTFGDEYGEADAD